MKKYFVIVFSMIGILSTAHAFGQQVDSTKLDRTQSRIQKHEKRMNKREHQVEKKQRKLDKQAKKVSKQEKRKNKEMKKLDKQNSTNTMRRDSTKTTFIPLSTAV